MTKHTQKHRSKLRKLLYQVDNSWTAFGKNGLQINTTKFKQFHQKEKKLQRKK